MTIEVKNCGECPFAEYDYDINLIYCNKIQYNGNSIIKDDYKTLSNCPLKTEPITVKIHEQKSEKK